MSEPFSSPEHGQYIDNPYPYPLPYGAGDALCDDSEFSALMESLSNEPGYGDDGAGPIYALAGYPDPAIYLHDYTPTLSAADCNAPVVSTPGPANFFDGVPVLDS